MPDANSKVAQALRDTFISPNELDRNLEPANVVDGLSAIARAVNRLAAAVERLAGAEPAAQARPALGVKDALDAGWGGAPGAAE